MNGTCRICGYVGKLSFEHIPPKSAFNNSPVIIKEGESAIRHGPGDSIRGKILQPGFGKFSLCPRCNNNTGAWYASNFVNWCHHGMEILKRSNGNPGLVYLNYLIPLRIIKQIITIFFTVNGEGFSTANPYLVEFILNKEKRFLPKKYRIFCYYNWEGGSRSSGITAIGGLHRSSPILLSEFSFVPYGYVMCYDSEPPDPRLFEITHFANYGYNDFKVMTLEMKTLPTILALPGDYRTKKEIQEAYNLNIKRYGENAFSNH